MSTEYRDWSELHKPSGFLFPPVQDGQQWNRYRLTQQEIQTFEKDGFLNHVRVLTEAQCDLLLDDYKYFMGGEETHPMMDLLYEYHSNQSEDPDNVLMHALGHWRLTPGFHDLIFTPSVVVHIALEDQTEENGTIQYIPGSHRWTRKGGPLPVLDFNFKDMEGIKTILTPEERASFQPVPAKLKKGEAAFHHALCVHGSYQNRLKRPDLSFFRFPKDTERSDRPRRTAVLNYFADGTRSDTDQELLKGSKVPKGEAMGGQLYPLVYNPVWSGMN